MPEIQVQSLTKDFADSRALDDVGFTVAHGELFTLLGPSGCGKSTTLMSIAGFQQPEHGRIAVGDETFLDTGSGVNVAAERRNLGIVFQSYAVWPHMTVFQNLAYPLKVRKLKRGAIAERVRETLELVELAPYADRYPHQLSGGQQQRVALARALVYKPTVMLLDEPFSNLDAKLRERARVWVKDLQRSLGLTTIFVTHDQDEALSMSDRIAVMDHGRIQQIGSPEDVYRRPANRFVADFVGRVNLLAGTVASRDGEDVVVEIGDSQHRLTLAAPDGSEVGPNVTIAVRPEAVHLVAPGETSNGTNTWEADVQATAFLGDHYDYELAAGPLALTVQSARRVDGDRVRIHIPREACALVEG